MPRDFPAVHGSFLSVPDDGPTDITGTAITMSAWVYPDTYIGSNALTRRIISKDSNASTAVRQYLLGLVNNAGASWSIRMDIGDAVGIDTAQGGTGILIGGWRHCVGRKSPTLAQVFYNGVLDGASASSKSMQAMALPVWLGDESANTVDRTFDGKMADVAIWDVALADEEILALSKGVSPVLIRRAALKGYWPLLGLNLNSEIDLSGGVNMAQTGTIPNEPVLRPPAGRWSTYSVG